MSLHRFYLPPDQCQGTALVLNGSEAHHALHVLRLQRGERVLVLDGAGHEFSCEVQACTRHEVNLALREQRSVPPLPYQITLVQAVPKGKLMDGLIQKATELETFRIVPLLSERVVLQLDGEKDAVRKTAKWQAVATEAIKQCGSAWLPKVEEPVTVEQWLTRGEKFELSLIASLQPGSKHPREQFQAFAQAHGRMPSSVCLWVGPEGDFAPGEIAAAQSAGALPITLGRLVLRVETAAIYCLSVLNNELQYSALRFRQWGGSP